MILNSWREEEGEISDLDSVIPTITAARGGRPARASRQLSGKRERARTRVQQERVAEAAEFWGQRKVDAEAADTRTELRTDARPREEHEDVGAPHHRALL